jgi:membrane fusion protein (multidrug efflux system)
MTGTGAPGFSLHPNVSVQEGRKLKLRRTLACLALCGILAVASCDPREEAEKTAGSPVRVEAARVKVAPLDDVVRAVGSLASPQETLVSPQIDGKVVALDIEQGKPVTKGTILVRLDDTKEKAAVMAAEAALANARQIYQRDREVAESGAISAQQLQSDEAAVRQARAQLDQVQADLEHTRVAAPFTGVLGLRQVSLGAYVSAGDNLVHIRQLDPLYLDFYVPQQHVSRLALGQEVRFAAAGLTDEFRGEVTTVDQALEAVSRTVHVQATVPNHAHLLKPGMFALVQLVVGKRSDVLFVPMQAIVPEGQVRHVWVVGPEDRAQQRTVEVGVYEDNWVQITSGLKPDDRVVTAGVQKLYPNAKLIVTSYQSIHNPRLDLTNPGEKVRP